MEQHLPKPSRSRIAFAALVVIVLLLGAFSLFVGYHKAFSPLSVLRENSAWTAHLPVLLGRAIGWAELAAAATMIAGLGLRPLRRWGAIGAMWITLNHVAAAVVHVLFKEWHTLLQSGVVIALCVVMVWAYRKQIGSQG